MKWGGGGGKRGERVLFCCLPCGRCVSTIDHTHTGTAGLFFIPFETEETSECSLWGGVQSIVACLGAGVRAVEGGSFERENRVEKG